MGGWWVGITESSVIIWEITAAFMSALGMKGGLMSARNIIGMEMEKEKK